MKRTLSALAAAGFLAVLAGPALAGGGCGNWGSQSVGIPDRNGGHVAEGEIQGEQSTPAPTQTASTDDKSG